MPKITALSNLHTKSITLGINNNMKNTIPYTYRIKCLITQEYYYGVRFAKGCNPNDLWKFYFTHSKKIKQLREKYGDNCWKIEIRKIFKTATTAIKWENRVNKFTVHWNNYLNENTAGAINSVACSRGTQYCISNNLGIHGLSDKQRKINSSKGGEATKNNKTGIFSRTKEQRHSDGLKGLQTQKENKTGFYGLTFEQHSELGKKYGKKGGSKTKALKAGIFDVSHPLYYKWRRDAAVLGGESMKGMKWWNNGIKKYKIITMSWK